MEIYRMFVSFELTCGPLNVNRGKIPSYFAWIDVIAEDYPHNSNVVASSRLKRSAS